MAKTPFLADLHSRFGLSRAQVVRIASGAVDREIEDIRRLARGYDNEVYRVTVTGELVLYVRIRRHGEGTLEQEVWAMELARAGGVPVPDVLSVDPSCEAADGYPVTVVAAAPGLQLEGALATASGRERRQLLAGLGEMLARLHVIDMGCGDQVTADSGPTPTRCAEASRPNAAASTPNSWRPG